MRLNIFRNPSIESYLSHYRIAHEEKTRQSTETFWRGRVALEIMESCVATKKNGEPCEVCKEMSELIILRGNRKRKF